MRLLLLLSLLIPDFAGDAYQRGVIAFQAGKLDEAGELFRQVVAKDQHNAAAWKGLGAVYAAKSDFESADKPFQRACALQPDLPDACYYLGRNRYTQNQFDSALDTFKKALPYDQRPWRVHVGAAQSLDALGRSADAEEEFRRAIRLYNGAPEQKRTRSDENPHLAYGVFLFRAGRPNDALPALMSAVAAHPGSPEARLELGRTLHALGKTSEAIAQLERAVELDPASLPAHLLLGKTLIQTGRAAEGQRQLELARGIDDKP